MSFSRAVLRTAIGLTLLLGLCLSAQAVSVVDGTIYYLGPSPTTPGGTETTVDHIYFTVNTSSVIAIDVLSVEVDNGFVVDVNGDGEIAFIDPYIYLFTNDGSLEPADVIAYNDDAWPGGPDGSVSEYDSYLFSVGLVPAGSYVLAIGDYYLDVATAATVGGTNPNSFGPYNQYFVVIDHGDYRVTFTGDVTVIPEPVTLAGLVLGVGGLAGYVRRRARA